MDPSNSITLSSLSWDTFFKYTKIKLEMVNKIEILDMLSNGIRGEISTDIALKFAKANNKDLNCYNEKKSSIYIIYLDVNNLYEHSMFQPLPVSNFKFWDDLIEDLSIRKFYKIAKDNKYI